MPMLFRFMGQNGQKVCVASTGSTMPEQQEWRMRGRIPRVN